MMSTDHWIRIEALFTAALEQPVGARSAFVATHCVGDDSLRREVEALLDATDSAGELRGAIARKLRDLSDEHGAGRLGQRVAGYRLVRVLGAGGMGVVYLATRDRGAAVAIKILAATATSTHALARFRDEQEILAELEHPHIVRLLGAGHVEDGSPYLLMEYVDGLPITDHVSQFVTPLRGRLALTRAICGALSHAHQRDIVHNEVDVPAGTLGAARAAPDQRFAVGSFPSCQASRATRPSAAAPANIQA